MAACQGRTLIASARNLVDVLCKAFGLDDERTIALLPIPLTDKALADYNDLETKQLQDLSYEKVCEELKNKFRGAKGWVLSQEALFKETMKPGESVAASY